MKRQSLPEIRKRLPLPLFVLIFFLMISTGAEFAEAENSDNITSKPEYTDFYNTQYYYEQFKKKVDREAGSYTGTPFDENIDCFKAAMGIGINFGNELDWNYVLDEDLPSRQRRYELIIEAGHKDGTSERVYYTYTQPFNAQGNLFTGENRPDPTSDFASLKLKPTADLPSGETAAVNFIRAKVKNDYYGSWKKSFTVNVKEFRLTDAAGNELFRDGSYLDRYPITIPTSYNTSSARDLFSADISPAVDVPSESPEIRAHIQLENFVSDYTGNAELTAIHADNMKMRVKKENGESEFSYDQLDKNLDFLKSQGIKTIRLPLTWYCHMDSRGTVDPEWFTLINRVVDRMIDKGFYVIVNIHNDTGKKGWIKADRNLYKGYNSADGTWHPGYDTTYRYLCLQLANNFKYYDHHLIIQGPNEVVDYDNNVSNYGMEDDPGITEDEFAVMNELNQIFVDEVRRTGYNNTNRILLCNTFFSERLNLPNFALPLDNADNKIFVGIHEYSFVKDKQGNPTGMLIALNSFKNNSAYKNYPKQYNILMDESGMEKTTSLESRLNFMEKSIPAAYHDLGIPMLLWDEGGKYAIMKRDQASWDESHGSDQVAAKMLEKFKENALEEHDWLEPSYEWNEDNSTCEAKIVCSRDQDHVGEREIVNTTSEKVDSTCTAEGSISYSATFESDAFATQKKTVAISPKGHDPAKPVNENAVDPTCDLEGSYDEVVYCSRCKAELSRETKKVPAIGHAFGKWTMADNEKHRRICSHDDTHIEYADHQWDQGRIIIAPNYTSTGVKEFSCSVCNGVRSDTLPRIPYPAGADPNQKSYNGTAIGPGASAVAAETAITRSSSEEGPSGSQYAPLMLRSTSQANTRVTLTWNRIPQASKYVVYGNACGKNSKMRKLVVTKGRAFAVKKISRALKKGTYYKFTVVALDSRNSVVSTSKVIHVATKGGKVGNYKALTIQAKINENGKAIRKYKALSRTKLKRGATVRITSTVTPASKKLKVRKHRGIAFVSSNPRVASVAGNGMIKARSRGNCYIYAYTQNGIYKRLLVSVR